jgi:sugar phosphate permease
MRVKSDRIKRIQIISVTLLVIAGLVNYLDRSTLSFANHSISEEMHLSASQMGILLSAFSLPYAFAQLPMGVLLDRLGARVMLGFGMLLWSAAQFAGGLVQTVNQFFLARFVLGIGEAPAFPAGAKVFSEWFAIRERGRPTGMFTASTTIAPALAPPLLTWLMLAFGWRGMFVAMGGLGILAAIGWIALYRDRRAVALESGEVDYLSDGDKASAEERKVTGAEWSGLLAKRTTWGILFGWMGVIYMVWLYLTWLPGYLEKERGVTLAQAGWMVIAPYVAGTVGQLSSGFIADSLLARGMTPIASRKWPICIGLIFAALFTVPAAYTPSLALALVYISLAMFFVNLSSGAGWALVSVSAPRRLVATLGSFMNFGGYLGASAAPVITGFMVDKTGSFVPAFVIAAAVALAGALVYLAVVKDPIRDPAESPVGS